MQTLRQRLWYIKNREALLQKAKAYRNANAEAVRLKSAFLNKKNRSRYYVARQRWALNNPDKMKASRVKYAERNPQCARLNSAIRRARRIRAVPKWLTKEQRKDIRIIYKTCPKGYEVDHIIPLKGENVSGLHVSWNLRHLPKAENRAKRNNHE